MYRKLKKINGFSLIELMVTVAILGILSAMALPSYKESVLKGKRSEAKVELLRIAQMQESYFVQNLSYAKDLTQLGFATNSIKTENDLYNVTMPAGGLLPAGCDPAASPAVQCSGYTVTALPDSAGTQAEDDTCKGFMIDNVGRKSAYGGATTAFGTTAAHIASSKECWR